jgi:nicotinate-nucleotide adenylyltransferase
MAPLAQRLAWAQRIGMGRRIIATAIEAELGTRYTADTIAVLRQRFPRCRFVWLMGADNLTQFPRWNRWREIAASVPVAVFPRPGETRRGLAGQAAKVLRAARHPADAAPALAGMAPPAWTWLPIRENSLSATALRRTACGLSLSPKETCHSPPPDPLEASRKPGSAQARRTPPGAETRRGGAESPWHAAQEGRHRRAETAQARRAQTHGDGA